VNEKTVTITQEKIMPNLAQAKALKNFENWKENKGVIVLPTGVGKTILSALIAKKFKGRILFIAHKQEILDQARKEYKKILGNKTLTSFYNASKKQISKITFATVQTLTRNLDKFEPSYIIKPSLTKKLLNFLNQTFF